MRYLGIMIDDKLSLMGHLDYTRRKASSFLARKVPNIRELGEIHSMRGSCLDGRTWQHGETEKGEFGVRINHAEVVQHI